MAIPVIGARYRTEDELHARAAVAGGIGMPQGRLVALAAGTRPPDLDRTGAATSDLASALRVGGTVPAIGTARAETPSGRDAVAELVFPVELHASVSVTLDGFREVAPEGGARRPSR